MLIVATFESRLYLDICDFEVLDFEGVAVSRSLVKIPPAPTSPGEGRAAIFFTPKIWVYW